MAALLSTTPHQQNKIYPSLEEAPEFQGILSCSMDKWQQGVIMIHLLRFL